MSCNLKTREQYTNEILAFVNGNNNKSKSSNSISNYFSSYGYSHHSSYDSNFVYYNADKTTGSNNGAYGIIPHMMSDADTKRYC